LQIHLHLTEDGVFFAKNDKSLAIQAEDNFDFEKALEYYEKAFQSLTVEDGSLIRYANLLFEFQEYEKAKRVFEKIVEKCQDKEYLLKLAQIYEELDLKKSAIDTYERLGMEEKVKELKDQELQVHPNRSVLEKFSDLFSGREDVFAVQSDKGYYPVRRPMNFEDIKEHLNGLKTLGTYVLRSDNSVKFAVYDVDIKKQYIYDEKNVFKYETLCRNTVREICNVLSTEDLSYHLEYSGWRGYHIWLFFSEWLQAYKVKGVLEALVRNLEVPEEINIEVFPKQADLNGGLGNLVKLPLGVHLKTLKRCSFLNEKFEIIPNQIDYMLKITPNDKSKIETLYQKLSIEHKTERQLKSPSKLVSKPIAQKKKTDSLKKILRKDIQRQSPQKFLLALINACSVLKQINDKIERTAYIEDDEEFIFIRACIPLDNSKDLLHETLKKTINYSFERVESTIQNNGLIPITCQEIRKIVFNKALKIDLSRCNCKFNDVYDTPCALLKDVEEIFLNKVDVSEIVKRILDKTAEKAELEKEIKNLRMLVAKKLENQGEISTTFGKVRRVDDDDIEIII
jgi:hypothetical protein